MQQEIKCAQSSRTAKGIVFPLYVVQLGLTGYKGEYTHCPRAKDKRKTKAPTLLIRSRYCLERPASRYWQWTTLVGLDTLGSPTSRKKEQGLYS